MPTGQRLYLDMSKDTKHHLSDSSAYLEALCRRRKVMPVRNGAKRSFLRTRKDPERVSGF